MTLSANITILVDNSANDGLVAEHGFSAWIETGERNILFDTGQGNALLANACMLDIDLRKADSVVLSHGHYDHSGGLAEFLTINGHASVIYAEGATQRRLSCHEKQPPKDIGMPELAVKLLDELPDGRNRKITAPLILAPGIGVTGPIPRQTSFEDSGGPFYFDKEKSIADPIIDDGSIWLETTHGLVILTGCCHAGIVNTIHYARQLSGIDKVSGIIGGLHLLHAKNQRLERTFDFLSSCHLDFIRPCHCTGEQAIERMIGEIETQTTIARAGTRLYLELPAT